MGRIYASPLKAHCQQTSGVDSPHVQPDSPHADRRDPEYEVDDHSHCQTTAYIQLSPLLPISNSRLIQINTNRFHVVEFNSDSVIIEESDVG